MPAVRRISFGTLRGLLLSLAVLAVAIAAALILRDGTSAQSAPVAVWTHHNNNQRTGANLNETQLTTSTVSGAQFGKLFSYVLDADVYTQPLVIPNVAITGKGTHTVVYVATMNNSVYALDANDNKGNNGTPLWYVNLNNPAAGVIPVPAADLEAGGNLRNPGPVGIMGTPVIDQASSTMYFVARTRESGVYVQKLHALDIRSGAEKPGGPVTIQASVPGSNSYDSVGGVVTFNTRRQNPRPALTLANGLVYIMWASIEDRDPYHAWIMAYDASTLNQIAVWCSTPNGSRAGIWMSGQGATVDEFGNVYAITGNGTFTADTGGKDYGEALVKLSPMLASVSDWFAPNNWSFLNGGDLDFGSAGALIIPGTNLILGGGKFGRFYLLDRSNLGHVQPADTQIVQSFQVTNGGHIHGSPVYWNAPGGPLVYVMGEEDFLKGYRFNGLTFDTTPATMSTFAAAQGMPGGFLSISANGSTAGSGIVWVNMPSSGNAENAVVSGILRAFDASDLTRELWNSNQNSARDGVGNYAKYVSPTVANGRVYLPTFSAKLNVYGLLNSYTPPSGGLLTVTSVQSSSTVDLTAVGTSDWARWPGYARKASGASQISDVTVTGGTPTTYTNDARVLTWSDGTSPVSGSTQSGIQIPSIGSGFSLSAPADTTARTLTLYVGGSSSTGRLTARLSDGSAQDVFGTEIQSASPYDAVHTISYRANSAGQRLYVQWSQVAGGGSVTLQAAALAGGVANPPAVPTNVAASDGTSTTSVNVTWNAVSGALNYTVYRSTAAGTLGNAIGSPTSNSFSDTTVTPGLVYYYSVTATGAGGTSAPSTQNSGFASVVVPGVPTNVSATDGTSSISVTVTWTAVTGATSYTVYRSTSAGTQGSSIGSPTTALFSDTTATPGTTYYYGVTASNSAGTSNLSAQDSGFVAVGGTGGGLAGVVIAPTTPVNLTTIGSSDWTHWTSPSALIRKSTGGSQISTFTALGSPWVSAYTNDPRTLTWTDGTPTASGSSTKGVYIGGVGNGFQITAPADVTVRAVTVYVGGWNSSGQLTASLSDGSAPAYVSPVLAGSGQYNGVYQLTYQAASAAKALTIQWKQTAGAGNVTLQAAALAASGGTPPGIPTNVAASDGTSTSSVSITWTAVSGATNYTVYRSTSSGTQGSAIGSPTNNSFNDTTATPGLIYYYGVTASNGAGTSSLSAQDAGHIALSPPGVPTNVAASDGTSTTSVTVTWTAVTGATSYTVYRSTTSGVQGNSVGTPTTNQLVDSTVTPGTTYYYSVTASNSAGTSNLSAQNSGFAATGGGGGGLVGAVLTPTTSVNLTTVGTSDWAHWNANGFIHKSTGGSQISTYTPLGSPWVSSYPDDPRTVTWTDGTPTASGSSTQGVFLGGVDTGFQITAPADLTVRVLTVYVGGWNSSGQLTATLSDGSAPVYTSPVNTAGAQYDGVYQLTYSAASAGRTLTVQWKQNAGTGNVTLQAAALSGSGASAPGVPTNVAASDGTSPSSVSVTWSAVSGATSYTVYRSTTSGVQGNAIGSPTNNSFSDTTATPGLVYYYGVTATGPGGTSGLSTQDAGSMALSPPGVPTNVSASDGTSTTSVTVTWTAVTGATSYTVYRSGTSGVQGNAVGTPTTNQLVDSTVTPGTMYFYSVTASNGAGTSGLSTQNSGFAATSGGGGGLTAAVLTPTTPVNLTTMGTSDWGHWTSPTGFIHKSTGGSKISTYTALGSPWVSAYTNDPRTVTWTDGTPTASGSSTQGVFLGGIGNGFQITAPADTTTRILTVYVGGWNSSGQLTVSLSDGSAAAYVSPVLTASGQFNGVYQLTYHAASAGRTVTVQWKQTAGTGNVTLQAAALQ